MVDTLYTMTPFEDVEDALEAQIKEWITAN